MKWWRRGSKAFFKGAEEARHPAIAGGASRDTFILAYDWVNEAADTTTIWWEGTCDGGQTWDRLSLDPQDWQGFPQYPSLDYWSTGKRFYGTFVTPPQHGTGGNVYELQFTDPCSMGDSVTASYFALEEDGWHDMRMAEIACRSGGFGWAWRMLSFVGSTELFYPNPPDYIDGPFALHHTTDSTALLTWFMDRSGCRTTSCDIDDVTHLTYGVWDWFNGDRSQYQLIIREDFYDSIAAGSQYFHVDNRTWLFPDPSVSIRNPDVAAHNGNVVVALEVHDAYTGDVDVQIWFSSEGRIDTFDFAYLTNSYGFEGYPEVEWMRDSVFVCTFYNDLDEQLYISISDDGGATWSDPSPLEAEDDGSAVKEYGTACLSNRARKVAWEFQETGSTDIEIHHTDLWNDPPECSSPDPQDGATNIVVTTSSVGVLIEDEEGHSLDWTIQTTPDVGSGFGVGDSSGFKTCAISGLDSNTVYTWVVSTVDEHGLADSVVYTFITEPSDFACGDVNADERVTIADANYLVTFLYRQGPVPMGQADVNLDGRLTVADATYIASYIYRDGRDPCEPVAGSGGLRGE
jgi:hypothetical protein